MMKAAILILLVISARHVHADPFNCVLTIRATLKSGKVSEKVYRSQEKSKADCEKAAKLHEQNFAPQSVAKKKVTMKWLGRP